MFPALHDARVTNFDADLRDAVPLFAALASYWPGAARYRAALHVRASHDKQVAENVATLGRAMQVGARRTSAEGNRGRHAIVHAGGVGDCSQG